MLLCSNWFCSVKDCQCRREFSKSLLLYLQSKVIILSYANFLIIVINYLYFELSSCNSHRFKWIERCPIAILSGTGSTSTKSQLCCNSRNIPHPPFGACQHQVVPSLGYVVALSVGYIMIALKNFIISSVDIIIFISQFAITLML